MRSEFFIITSLLSLIVFIFMTNIFTKRERQGESYLLAKYLKKTEKQIYEEKLKDSKEELLEEIKRFDYCLKKSEKAPIIAPFTRAMFSKADEFGREELLRLLDKSKGYEMLDEILVDIYLKKNYDKQSLKTLFYESAISVGAKEHILQHCEFSIEELEQVCFVHDNSFAVIAMKQLLDKDEARGFAVSKTILFDENYLNNPNKLYIAALGICYHYKKEKVDEADKLAISERVRNILRLRSHLKHDLARTQLICVLANNHDFEDFRYLVSSEDIEQEFKASLIEKNVDLILDKMKEGASREDLDCILLSMSIYPVKEVGDKLNVYAKSVA